MSRFFSSRHASLVPYTPGEQPKVLSVTKLNTNECPFPPSEKALRFVAENTRPLNLYPELQFVDIRGRLAGLYGISPDNFILGNGSDELLNFAFMAFCDDQKQAAFPNISYGFYPVYANSIMFRIWKSLCGRLSASRPRITSISAGRSSSPIPTPLPAWR